MARSFSNLLLILAFMMLRPLALFAAAALQLDASARMVHEDNVNALLSGAGRPLTEQNAVKTPVGADVSGQGPVPLPGNGRQGDFYSVAAANVGVSSLAGPGSELSLTAAFERFRFNRFTALDASTAGLRTDLLVQFTDMHAARAALLLDRAWYDEDALTGSRWGGGFELLQQTASKFWVGEGLEYERRRSRDSMLASRGRSATLRSGYRFRDHTSVTVTYRHLIRRFDGGSRILLDSLALAGIWEVVRHVQVQAAIERQLVATDPQASRTGNTITSAGVAYVY